MAKKNKKPRSILDRADDITNDQQTVNRINRLAEQTGYHPTYIAAWVDVENAKTPEERANRSAQMIRTGGDAFDQYSGNSQRQYETGQQMKNSRKNRKHQTNEAVLDRDFRTDERIAGQDYRTGEREADEKFTTENTEKTLKGNRNNIKFQSKKQRQNDALRRQGQQEDTQQSQDFTTKTNEILQGYELESIDARNGTGPSALEQITADTEEFKAAEPSSMRIGAIRRQNAELYPNESEEESTARIREDQQPYYADKFQDGTTVTPGNLPLGLQQELRQVVGEKDNAMNYEEFCDYLDVDVTDPASDSEMKVFYQQVTGNTWDHDHWF